MQTMENFAPTGLDPAGGKLPDRADWLVVARRDRDSPLMFESNFDTALHLLGGMGEDVEVHRYRHWACGWLEIIIVRPGTEAETKAADIERRLGNYPLLNEDDYTRRQVDRFDEQWTRYGAREFVAELAKKFDLDPEEEGQLDDYHQSDEFREFFRDLDGQGSWHDDGYPYVYQALENATYGDVLLFLLEMTDADTRPDNPGPTLI